ncbi:TEA domain-containing protein [Mycena sanguinolenta]|uniref:TEA domain-containing protein n=1 Tax=Mycena sanguinolenta TaxID=230812 RepID=A0A8H6ZGC1_9AGAR|nr:TEA domain-containing protein [Mycena sanguinolenta]
MYWNNDPECAEETASTGSSTPPTPSADRLYAPLSGNGWPTMQSQTTKDVLQSVLKVRKSWKTLRGGETVWPLDLEAALLEGENFLLRCGTRLTPAIGLENYQPDDSRETRMLGRFPRRNRFISDYIFQKTGKRRSAKQVGSRLQQLRESCGGKKLLHLLSPFRQPPYAGSSASSDSSCNSPVSPLGAGQAFPNTSARHTVVHIDILPEEGPDAIDQTNRMWLEAEDNVHVSDRPPRRLSSINPTVTFTSPNPVAAESRFTVYSEDRVVHAETTTLTPVHSAPVPGFLYSTTLVPEYWKAISESSDPTRFTIYQEVSKRDDSTLIFSATYKFAYPAGNSSSSSLDTLNSPDTRAAVAPTASSQQFHGDRYPLYIAPEWSPTLPSREHSPAQVYRSPSSDSSTCFPSELSNYVL